MINKFLDRLSVINPWHFVWIAVLLSEILTLLTSTLFCHLVLDKPLSRDIFLIGAFDAFIVSLLVVSIIIFFLKKNQELKEIIVANEAKLMLETKLRQAYKMDAIGTMAGGIAHDFNNMLAVVLGNTDIILDDLPPGHPYQYNIEQVLQASNRTKDLVRQILAFSHKKGPQLIPVALQAIIRDTLKLLRPTTPQTISVVESISEDCGTIMADPLQLQQLMMNLFSNAVDAIDTKGEISIKLHEVDLNADDLDDKPGMNPGPYLCLSLTDTGIGMAEETINRIFDPFYTTKDIGEGAGLGLSVIHGIVENHGAMLKVNSTPGQGSTFKVFFPVVTQKEENPIP